MRMDQVGEEIEGPAHNGVQSAEVALRVLAALSDAGGQLHLTALAAAAGMAPAKAHRYVMSLVHTGFVERTSRGGSYALGAKAMQVGLVALGRLDMMECATAALYDLRERIDETILLGIWGGGGATVVRLVESSHAVTLNVRIGSQMPLVASATGQVFGAYLRWDIVLPILRRELADAKRLGAPCLSEAQARARFDGVRKRGFSYVDGEMLAGIRAIGAPVFNAAGELAAALTVLGVGKNFSDGESSTLTGILADTARHLSQRLGHSVG
jgi:DNA-binding IclR family transcriptional regulator